VVLFLLPPPPLDPPAVPESQLMSAPPAPGLDRHEAPRVARELGPRCCAFERDSMAGAIATKRPCESAQQHEAGDLVRRPCPSRLKMRRAGTAWGGFTHNQSMRHLALRPRASESHIWGGGTSGPGESRPELPTRPSMARRQQEGYPTHGLGKSEAILGRGRTPKAGGLVACLPPLAIGIADEAPARTLPNSSRTLYKLAQAVHPGTKSAQIEEWFSRVVDVASPAPSRWGGRKITTASLSGAWPVPSPRIPNPQDKAYKPPPSRNRQKPRGTGQGGFTLHCRPPDTFLFQGIQHQSLSGQVTRKGFFNRGGVEECVQPPFKGRPRDQREENRAPHWKLPIVGLSGAHLGWDKILGSA
jgi:hypothetical protein